MNSRIDSRPGHTSGGTTRIPALLLTAVVAAAVCALATWPRWHPVGVTSAAAQLPALNVPEGVTSGASGAAGPSSASGTPPVPRGTVRKAGSVPSVAPPAPPSAASATSPPVPSPATPPAAPVARARFVPEVPDSGVSWRRLDEMQRIALAPFASEWDGFSFPQQRKWLAIASVYTRMSPEAQQRLHARMLRWTQMTPDERRIARENYEMSRVLPPNARQQAWHAYLALPDAQKENLAAAERSHRRPLVVSAPPGGNPVPHSRHAPPRAAAHAASDTSAPRPTPGPGAAAPANVAPAAAMATPVPTPPPASASHRHSGAGALPAVNQGDGDLSRP
ncbi:DUF3106 domain-containing protein [Robbsia sp. Bb-Pol-6]|uniref:DUF3106 domain-containing protein n=1 Tax=Robbsia betulipollinis TaxID=2981849 RepID=A0ABT3ZMN3_9BURK|nr:DUF3106 domain-containing protein [Robbsia betulipollinis]MCY0387732.1 DUF3106 domain-containing protein [Robbsia betulipollinis]